MFTKRTSLAYIVYFSLDEVNDISIYKFIHLCDKYSITQICIF